MKYGVNEAKRVPCRSFPKTHDYYPADEHCSICGPSPEGTYSAADMYVSRTTGIVYNGKIWPNLRADEDFMCLALVPSGSALAKMVCGCFKATCTKKRCLYAQLERTVCKDPSIAEDPAWYRVA